MMRTATRAILLLLLAVLPGCAPPGPNFGDVAAALPPSPPGAARFFFYRWLEPYETLGSSTVYLNGTAVGVSELGAVLYRDVSPGQYLVEVYSPGVYPNQFKNLRIEAGQTVYLRIESLESWARCGSIRAECTRDTFTVNVMDPAVAQLEMRDLRLIGG